MSYDIFMFDDKPVRKMTIKELKVTLNYYEIKYPIKCKKQDLIDLLGNSFLTSKRIEIKVNNKSYFIQNNNHKNPIKSFILSDDKYETYHVSYPSSKTKYLVEYNTTWNTYLDFKNSRPLVRNVHQDKLYNDIRNSIKYIEFRDLYFKCFYLKGLLIKDIWTHIITMFTDESFFNYKLFL